MTIIIPSTVEAATAALTDLGTLITAREWERAAIVTALVGPPTMGRPPKVVETHHFPLTVMALTDLRIVGLSYHATVEQYRDAWLSVRPVPTLGESVDMTDMPAWPPSDLGGRNVKDADRREAILSAARAAGMKAGSKALDIASNPRSLTVAIVADEATAKVAAEALAERARAELPEAEEIKRGGKATFWSALKELISMRRKGDQFVAGLQGGTPSELTDDERQIARVCIQRVRVALDLAEALVEQGGVTDAALAEWLGEVS